MAKRKTCYRLYVGTTCVAQGDIEYIAQILGVSVSTAQHYPYEKHCPKELRLEPLPILYQWNGALLTADEVARSAGVAKSTVITAAHRNQGVKGFRVQKYEYESHSLSVKKIASMRDKERAAQACI